MPVVRLAGSCLALADWPRPLGGAARRGGRAGRLSDHYKGESLHGRAIACCQRVVCVTRCGGMNGGAGFGDREESDDTCHGYAPFGKVDAVTLRRKRLRKR